jgi:acyl-coenzyme A synthetase/AMP-(fatty) acid ligase
MLDERFGARTDFDWAVRSPVELPPPKQYRYRSIWEMLFRDDEIPADQQIVLVGATESEPLEVTMADLRVAAARAGKWCRQKGLEPGDSVTLVRFPRTSEVPLAVASIALMATGIRVVLPMVFGRDVLPEILSATASRGVMWCEADSVSAERKEVRRADQMLRQVCGDLHVPTYCIEEEIDFRGPRDVLTPDEPPNRESTTEVLVFSTSGTTGKPKLVRYTDHALLTVAEAWQAAGLMSEGLTGGSSICPTISHSMGMRSLLHAVWNRRATLLIQPEWLEEQPKRFVQVLERCPPQHITCGPALLHDLKLLAGSVKRIRRAFGSLQCVVSSGAASTVPDEGPLAGVRLANAFGMTEVQQVLNTLIGPSSQIPDALGRPLPGVSVAIRYTDADRQTGRLFVQSPFAASGYVGQPDFGPWFDTGDIVRHDGNQLVWVARAEEDFFNTGLGIKVAGSELKRTYADLERLVESLIFVEAARRSGVVALAFVGNGDPTDPALHCRLRETICRSHERLASSGRDFELRYRTLSAVACVAGRPPHRGPGKVDRERILLEQESLLAAMDDPSADHPQVIHVPSPLADAPDWRRYARMWAPGK